MCEMHISQTPSEIWVVGGLAPQIDSQDGRNSRETDDDTPDVVQVVDICNECMELSNIHILASAEETTEKRTGMAVWHAFWTLQHLLATYSSNHVSMRGLQRHFQAVLLQDLYVLQAQDKRHHGIRWHP